MNSPDSIHTQPAAPTAPGRVAATFEGQLAEAFLARQFPPKEPLVEGLLHKRDLAALGARRRNGKTTFVTQLAVDLASAPTTFLGYTIPEPRRTLLMMLEDDAGEYQDVLRTMVGERDLAGRVKVITRNDFLEHRMPIDGTSQAFLALVRLNCESHRPDLIVWDNLAHLVGADYGDAKKIHLVMDNAFRVARDFDAAVIIAAHPKKEGDKALPISLEDNPVAFFESIMGSSHFINSTGSLWGLERHDDQGYTIFLGGRQRGDGQQAVSRIHRADTGRLELLDDLPLNWKTVVNTEIRHKAWRLLPIPPNTWAYREGVALVKTVMASSATYAAWMKDCRRLGVVVDAGDRLSKNPALSRDLLG